MDEEQKKAIGVLMVLYPHTIVGELGEVVWSHYLSVVPGSDLREIVDEWVVSETEPPTIAGLLEKWAERNGTDAESVWRLVERIVRNGEWRDPKQMGSPKREPGFTGDPVLEAGVQAAGGWAAFAKATEKDMTFLKRAFMEAYRKANAIHEARLRLAIGESPQERAFRLRIAGTHESDAMARRLKELKDGRSRDSGVTGEE